MTNFPSWLRIGQVGFYPPTYIPCCIVGVKCWNLGVFIFPWAKGANLMVKTMVKNEISQPEPSELDLVCGNSSYALAITIRALSAWSDSN